MAIPVKKSKDLICKHLGDVTPDEYEEYLNEEANIIAALIDRCDIEDDEIKREYKTFLNVVRKYYIRGTTLLTIATYNKIRPNVSQKEKKAMYFAAWVADWIATCCFVLNDICDKKARRASQLTLHARLGTAKAFSMYIMITNKTYDLASNILDNDPRLLPFLQICRHHVNLISLGMSIDTCCRKYERMRDPLWYQVREYTSSTAAICILPVELAFCMANKLMTPDYKKAWEGLVALLGPFARAVDDAYDVVSDTLGGRLNWAFWTAWQKATDEQRVIMLESCNNANVATGSPETLVELYYDLNIQDEFKVYTIELKKRLAKLCEDCPEEIPKKTWKDNLEFYHLIYCDGLGSTFHEH